MENKKPNKKNDIDLLPLISKMISQGNYIFLTHAKKRLKDRNITDLEVLEILENNNWNRKRNKSKDTYTPGYQDWNYCIEGNDIDGLKIRVIISFDSNLMLIITVIRISESE